MSGARPGSGIPAGDSLSGEPLQGVVVLRAARPPRLRRGLTLGGSGGRAAFPFGRCLSPGSWLGGEITFRIYRPRRRGVAARAMKTLSRD